MSKKKLLKLALAGLAVINGATGCHSQGSSSSEESSLYDSDSMGDQDQGNGMGNQKQGNGNGMGNQKQGNGNGMGNQKQGNGNGSSSSKPM